MVWVEKENLQYIEIDVNYKLIQKKIIKILCFNLWNMTEPTTPTPQLPSRPQQQQLSAAAIAAVPWPLLTRCQQGDSLLKFGRQGDPHFRNFKISKDFEFVTWRSKGKYQRIRLDDVKKGRGFLPGNLNGLFKRKTNKKYDGRMCFSLDYTTKTLDLVCSDADQYHAWSQSINYLLKYGAPSESERPTTTLTKGTNDKDDDDDDTLSTRVVSNNDVYTWGFGGQGQLGHNGNNVQKDLKTPTIVRHMLGKNVLGIACGLEHTVAMVKPGKLWAWGHGGGGRLGTKSTVDGVDEGDGTLLHELAPATVVGTNGVVFVGVACGDYHTLGLTSSGHLHSWGSGFYGQLGRSEDATETKVEDIEDIVAISASYTTSVAVSSAGALYTWGGGECGKLGHGATTTESGNARESSMESVEAKTTALNNNNNNSNDATVVGDVLFDDVFVPRIVSGLSSVKVRSVACGDFHTMVTVSTSFRTGGVRMFAWGNNQCGQLGLGDFTDRSTPTELSLSGMGLRNIPSIACGAMHSAAVFDVKSIGHTLYVWGCGKNGQLGLRRIGGDMNRLPTSTDDEINSSGNSSGDKQNAGMGGRRPSSFMINIDSKTNSDGNNRTRSSIGGTGGTGGTGGLGETASSNSSNNVNGGGNNSKGGDKDEQSSASAYCMTVPAQLKLHLVRAGRNGGGASGGNVGGSGSGGAVAAQHHPRRTSVMGALHLTSLVTTEEGVGSMLGSGGGLLLDPASVNCGANYTAVVVENTPAMRELSMAGRVFVFGRNDHGQLGEVRIFIRFFFIKLMLYSYCFLHIFCIFLLPDYLFKSLTTN